MKKQLSISTILFFALAAPAFAASDHANSHAFKTQTQPTVTVTVSPTQDPTATPSVTVTPTTDNTVKTQAEVVDTVTPTPACPTDGNYKNHGQYVSCVAHEHLGGQVTSQAARSDIGKKHVESTPTPSPLTSPVTSAQVSGTFAPLASVQNLFTHGLSGILSFFSHIFKH